MDKVFIVEIEYNLKGECAHEILAVTNENCINEVFKSLVEQEKSETYLRDFFNENGELRDGVLGELSEYNDNSKSFMLQTSDYEYFTHIYITEHNVITTL